MPQPIILNEILPGATYLGQGAEGLTLKSNQYVIKYWWTIEDFDTTYYLWANYHKWPNHVKQACTKLHICTTNHGIGITVTDYINVIDNKEGDPLPDHIQTALHWFAKEGGYNYKDLIELPNIGTDNNGKILLFDIL